MKHDIITNLGNFIVFLPAPVSADDPILDNFANTVNEFSKKENIDEVELEKALYDTTRAGDGAGVPLRLSLKNKTIELSIR